MKRLMAILLAFIIMRSLAGCGRQTVTETPQHTLLDLSYWKENYENAQAEISVGHSGNQGFVPGGQIMDFIESIGYGREASVRPLDIHFDTSHSVSFINLEEKKSLNIVFYNDFEYVAVYEDGRNLDNTPMYGLINKDKCRQFFIDNGFYMPPAVRTHIEDKIYNIINSDDVEQINRKVEPSGKDGSIVNIIPGQLKRLKISNVAPISYSYGDYMVCAKIAYDYSEHQKIYYATIFLDKNYDVASAYVTESQLQGEIISRYVIGDVDYSLWMEKADSCYHDFFRFWLGAGSSAHCESAMEWRTAVLRCINDLSLGELVDINTADYPRNQQYRIVLEEGNEYYNENPLVLEFYDDCRYVIICNCQQGEDNPVSVCDNHTKGYKVNNPEMVRRTFSLDGQYVSPQDYESLQRFAQNYMESTSVQKLNEMSDNDRNILDGWQFVGNVANFKAESTDHLSIDDGKEKFTVEFTAMYRKAVNENHNEHISYNIRMQVYRSGNSWKITSAYIY